MTAFLDTNVLIYAFADDPRRPAAQALIDGTAIVGVQCLNEFTAVSRRKQRLSWEEIDGRLSLIRAGVRTVVPLTVEDHDLGRSIAQRYRLALYDSMIVAAALHAGCDRLYSEDMQHGLVIDDRLHIANPFLGNENLPI